MLSGGAGVQDTAPQQQQPRRKALPGRSLPYFLSFAAAVPARTVMGKGYEAEVESQYLGTAKDPRGHLFPFHPHCGKDLG